MTLRRWIANEWNPTAGTAALTGAQAVHFARVLRGEPGTHCDVVAEGRLWRAVVTAASEERIEFQLEEELPSEPALPLTLLLSIFKFDRMEWAIEKATELGVERILPVVARRTEKHLAQAAIKRVERWTKIAREAAQQCRRAEVPSISPVQPLRDALAGKWEGTKLLLAETERTAMLRDALPSGGSSRLALAIGPEGGWTPEEVQMFTESAWQPVSLGPNILRVETAVIAAIAVTASVLPGRATPASTQPQKSDS